MLNYTLFVVQESRKSPRQRWIAGAVVVVVLVVVITAAVVTSVYLGNKMSQDNFKVKKQKYIELINRIKISKIVDNNWVFIFESKYEDI